MAEDRIERNLFIDAPVDVVWAVLTESDHVSGWFGDEAEIDLRPGGEFTNKWDGEPGQHVEHGRIEKVDAPRHFSYHWFRDPDSGTREEHSTLVEFTLNPEGDGTRLRVVESGFSKLDWPEDKQADDLEGHRTGWRAEREELREYAEGLEAA